jgi:hypothetical protein
MALLSFVASVPVLWLRARLAATAREGAKSPV